MTRSNMHQTERESQAYGQINGNGNAYENYTKSSEKQELRIEVGKTYLDRKGRKVKLINNDGHEEYPFDGDNGKSYTEKGTVYTELRDAADLVEEVKSELLLEVGKTYKTRLGRKVKITHWVGHVTYCFRGDDGSLYVKNGAFLHDEESPRDLIEEVLPELKLEVWKTYIARNGKMITIVKNNHSSGFLYPYVDRDGASYTEKGAYCRYFNSSYDLVKEAPPLQLEVGKTYLDRKGRKVKILRQSNESSEYPFVGDDNEDYSANGNWYIFPHPRDLVEEATQELQLEVGKTYLNGKGEKVRIAKCGDFGIFRYEDDHGARFDIQGKWSSVSSAFDLVSEVPEEKVLSWPRLELSPAYLDYLRSNGNPKDAIGEKKPRISDIPSSALIHQAKAHEYGHQKYGYFNWRNDYVQSSVYIDAAFRHLLAYRDGEDTDPDSGLSHLAHVAANCNILLDAEETENLTDTRLTKGNVADVIRRFTNAGKS